MRAGDSRFNSTGQLKTVTRIAAGAAFNVPMGGHCDFQAQIVVAKTEKKCM
jgi:hypothetical protein